MRRWGAAGQMGTARPIAAALAALVLASCAAGDLAPGSQQANVTGGIANAGPGRSTVSAAGIIGNGFGTGLDERDHQRAFAAEMQALEQGEPGEPVGWRGVGGRFGTVVPGAAYDTKGTRCRDYSHTIYIDGRPQTARATACRGTDGTWAPAG